MTTTILVSILSAIAFLFIVGYAIYLNSDGENAEEKGANAAKKIGEIFSVVHKKKPLLHRLIPFNMRIILPLLLIFITLHLLSDWTNYTVSKISPVALVFNNEMNQLWIAAKRFVFINGFVVLFLELVRFLPFWSKMANVIEEVKAQYNELTAWQRIKLYIFCLFGFALEFILLLQANLPVGSTLTR
jgi:hypothetical protein